MWVSEVWTSNLGLELSDAELWRQESGSRRWIWSAIPNIRLLFAIGLCLFAWTIPSLAPHVHWIVMMVGMRKWKEGKETLRQAMACCVVREHGFADVAL